MLNVVVLFYAVQQECVKSQEKSKNLGMEFWADDVTIVLSEC